MPIDAKDIYLELKSGRPSIYNEEKHCPMIIEVMANREKGTFSAFCIHAKISEKTFYNWQDDHPLFADCYSIGKMYARENWEQEGKAMLDIPYELLGCRFEHWRMIGWSKFGVGKNSRIRLNLDPKATPDKHYSQLIAASRNGEYTAGEIKQLMEAINVGLRADENFRLQDELNKIKSDVDKLELSRSGQTSITNTGTAQKGEDPVAGSLC